MYPCDTMTDLFDLSGKHAIVTGGARGLGQAQAKGLAEHGADVAIVDKLDTEETEDMVEAEGGTALGISADVSKEAQVAAMVDEVYDAWGSIDILVNNAGVWRTVPSHEETEEGFDEIMDVDLKGTFYCCKEVANTHMLDNGGKIINIASCLGHFATPAAVAYNAAKAGIIQMTKTLAIEWIEHGINVNAISPGFHETEMTKSSLEQDEFVDYIYMTNPRAKALERVGQPDEIRGTAVFLASEAADEVNGEVIKVDGGKMAMW